MSAEITGAQKILGEEKKISSRKLIPHEMEEVEFSNRYFKNIIQQTDTHQYICVSANR